MDDFSRFMRDRQAALLRLATALTGDPRQAEDVVADVLARLFEQWERIRSMERVNAYVRRMVVNEYLSRQRR